MHVPSKNKLNKIKILKIETDNNMKNEHEIFNIFESVDMCIGYIKVILFIYFA